MLSDDEKDFEPGDEDDSDPDTNLILDYLSNKLDPADAERLEERAKRDKDFRYKLADVVLLKGLVMLALEKNPGPAARACRRTQRMFLDYLKGRTRAGETAQLSRHLDECFECELAFERFQEQGGGAGQGGGWGGFWRRLFAPGRHLVAAGIVAAALAAGAFGVVGFLTSAGASAGAPPPADPDGPASPSGTMLRPSEVRAALSALVANDASVDAERRLSDLVDRILDPATEPEERFELYATLGRDFGAKAEGLLWAIADSEPLEHGRLAIYVAAPIGPATDPEAVIKAARREIGEKSDLALMLARAMTLQPNEAFLAFFRRLFENDEDTDDRWRAQILRATFGALKADPVAQRRMSAYLSHPDDRIRSLGIAASADAGDRSMVARALPLLKSPDEAARLNAALVIARYGTTQDREALLEERWSRDPGVWSKIAPVLHAQGFPLPENP